MGKPEPEQGPCNPNLYLGPGAPPEEGLLPGWASGQLVGEICWGPSGFQRWSPVP